MTANKEHAENKATRPKRRRKRDNPYQIFVIGAGTPEARHYARFKDGEGKEHCLEIEKEIYDLLDRFEREDLRDLNEYDRHYEHCEQTEQSIHRRAVALPVTVEEAVLKRLEYGQLHIAIRELSDKQRRRLSLHYFGGFKIKEIAEMESCDPSVISRSISVAKKKLKNLISD